MIEPPRPPATRCGTPAFTDFHTPLRLTSIISCQMSSFIRCEPSSDRADACVGDDDVQPSELLDAAVDGGLERVVIADVDLGGDDPPIQRLDHVGGFGEVFGGRRRGRRVGEGLADVDGDDVGAFLRQPHSVAAPLPPRRAGDECDLASTRPVIEPPR